MARLIIQVNKDEIAFCASITDWNAMLDAEDTVFASEGKRQIFGHLKCSIGEKIQMDEIFEFGTFYPADLLQLGHTWSIKVKSITTDDANQCSPQINHQTWLELDGR